MFKKLYFSILSSTNTYLKKNYQKYDHYTVIICNNQTGGHGRLGRTWEMEAGKNIAMSILLKPNKVNHISNLSLLTSAAVFLGLNKYTKNLQIKWPNDILLNGKKVCGILLESIYENKFEAIIIGIGINVNNTYFSSEIIKKATSLKKELNSEFNLEDIIDNILYYFNDLYQKYLDGNHEYLNICRMHSSIIGKNIYLKNKILKVEQILDNGNLLVKDGNKEEEIGYGEISLENNYQ